MTQVLFFILLFCTSSFAAQNALVTTDGAMVYRSADFDSQVIGYMRSAQKVRISSQMFNGAFYKVQFKQGVLGFIADTDVQTQNKNQSSSRTAKKELKNKSFIGKKYFGAALGTVHFSELFNKTAVSDNLLVYGVKYTGPLKLLTGPFVFDAEFLYHQGYPKYYDSTASRGESGRFALLDATVLYSLYESAQRVFWLYFGAGPLLSYSSFVVEIGGSKKDLTEIQFGGILTAGAALRLGKVGIKLEPKYFFLETSYFGLIASLQFEF